MRAAAIAAVATIAAVFVAVRPAAGEVPAGPTPASGSAAPATSAVAPTPAAPATVEKANYWRYAASLDGKPSAESLSWEGTEEDFANTRAFYVETYSAAGSAGSQTRVHQREYYRSAADGVYRVGTRSDIRSEGSTVQVRSATEGIDQPQPIELPIPFQLGSKWRTDSKRTSRTDTIVTGAAPGSQTSKSSVETTGTSEVVRRETVTVPAGTFDCLVVEITTKMEVVVDGGRVTSSSTGTSWYAPKVGLVKHEQAGDAKGEFKGVAPTTTHTTFVMTLSSYRVTRPSWLTQAIGFVDLPAPAAP